MFSTYLSTKPWTHIICNLLKIPSLELRTRRRRSADVLEFLERKRQRQVYRLLVGNLTTWQNQNNERWDMSTNLTNLSLSISTYASKWNMRFLFRVILFSWLFSRVRSTIMCISKIHTKEHWDMAIYEEVQWYTLSYLGMSTSSSLLTRRTVTQE